MLVDIDVDASNLFDTTNIKHSTKIFDESKFYQEYVNMCVSRMLV